MPNKGTCKASDCEREVIAKGYCRKHYRLWRHGEMPKPRYKICTEEKCRKPRFRASVCEEHWTAKYGKKPGETASAPAAEAASA
ncbi:MAG: vegetative protein [Candidatus Binataceae bacterium]|jgi:hypothetical protein